MRHGCLAAACLLVGLGPAVAQGAAALSQGAAANPAGASVFVEELTSPELRDLIQAGRVKTVLVPIGGTEQNGPHMVLGKHNVRVRALAGQIATRLGHTVVAPVMAYVAEGAIQPPQAHMRYSGTVSLPDGVFEAVIEAAARSFKQHGISQVVLLGDHGGYQKSLARVAARLNREWAREPGCRVVALTEYYQAAQTTFAAELKRRGYSDSEIGVHAGLLDTSLALAIDPALVRVDRLGAAKGGDGVVGDARKSSAELGQIGVQRIVDASVNAIQAASAAAVSPSVSSR
jgi:creatinine amidohydrolase/Fe(II)-dependent formamide hydrolase-like protein